MERFSVRKPIVLYSVERVTAAREEELHKTAVLHEEKLELETHMSELEQQRAQQDEAGHAHREEWEERLRGAQLGEESARKELHNLRTRLHQQTIRLEELERTTGELDDLKRQNQELGVRLGTLAHAEDELQASNRRLKDGQGGPPGGAEDRPSLEERRVQWLEEKHAAREEELHKTAVLHEEKLELETHMSELEQQRAQQDEAGHAHREEWEERLRGAQLGEESARKELHNLRTRLHQQTIRLEELERTTGELDDLKRQNQELGVRLGTLAHAEDELQASNRRLKDGQEVLREELRTARSQAERSQHDAERSLEEGRVQWLEEKHALQEHQEQKYSQAKERLHRAATAQKKRKTQTENKENRRPAHSEEQAILNRRLKELQQRHSEFHQLLLGHQATTGAGPAFPPSSHFAAPSSHITEEQHRWEVSLLHRRLEDLESVQQHQMEELGPPAQRDQDISGQSS
ncbi:hypothetical protein NHX12_020731 [Muraenolepis orangiensis]|uniref:Uncharacterized protein n=1 Tax=Muraenolepis orangiensis TaxID=630683 RepID=A0A9Q0ESH8_9TELE|nr:hypothetical protein NHX12_020731 [Muraenolepis orangiensis]